MEVNQPSDEVIKQRLKLTRPYGGTADISHILIANLFFWKIGYWFT